VVIFNAEQAFHRRFPLGLGNMKRKSRPAINFRALLKETGCQSNPPKAYFSSAIPKKLAASFSP